MNESELLVAIIVVMLRFYLIYLMYLGLLEVLKLDKIWIKFIYIMGALIYVAYTWTTSLDLDIETPVKIVGLISLNLVIAMFVATIKYYRTNKYPEDEVMSVVNKCLEKLLKKKK